jgi:polysaccharide biosynthesis/export protein
LDADLKAYIDACQVKLIGSVGEKNMLVPDKTNPSSKTYRFLFLSVFMLFFSGCASTGNLPAAPKKADSLEYKYVIGALDTLSITVWRNPELSTSIQVRPDGRISTPLIKDLQAVGRTPQELSAEIEKLLSNYIRDPNVTVIVTGFQGVFGEQIRIIGEAARPQSIPYRQGMTLLDVMIVVGGLTDFADGNSAVLVRGREGGKEYRVRIRDLVKRGDITANVEVKPGDVVIIPQGWF